MALPGPGVCDIEGLLTVSPLAVVALVSLSFDLLAIGACLPARAVLALTTYCAGLIALDRKQTAVRIAGYLGGLSHDKLTRMLANGHWHCSRLMLHFIRLIQCVLGRGYLIVDDTFIPHRRSRKMEGVYWDHDHAEGRHVYGQRLVLLLWSDGFWRIPVGFAFWHKKGFRPKYRTKNEMAQTLLKWAVHHGTEPDYITFDNWYASKANMKLIVRELGLQFVTRLKRNCRLLYEDRKLQARTIGRRVLKAARPYRRRALAVWARAAEVQVADLGRMTFVVVKDHLDGEKPTLKYLLASTPRLAAREVVRRYRSRWIIETLFRDLKQHLGLGSHQGLKLGASERHVAAACLAATVLDHARRPSNRSLRETKTLLQRLVFITTPDQPMALASLEPAPPQGMDDLDEAKRVLADQLELATGIALPKRPLLALA